MPKSLELLTTVMQSTLTPWLHARGVTTGRAKIGETTGGYVCAEIPVQYEASSASGILSVSVLPGSFPEGGPQWAILVCRIAMEGRAPLDKACIYTGGERLRNEFGELVESFINAPATAGPPPSLRRSTVVLDL